MGNERVFITGASRGIGRALALELGRRGNDLVLAARDEAALEAVAREITERGGRASWLRLDVSRPETIAPALAEAAGRLGGLDVVVANAGTGRPGALAATTAADLWEVFAVNTIGAVLTLSAALPHLRSAARPLLVGISSLAGYRGGPGSGPYNASKAAFISLLETLRMETAGRGIRVLDVRPGFVRTAMTDRNTFRMPFLMEAALAAERLADAIEKRRSRVVFPRRAGWVMTLLRHLPDAVFDRLAARVAARILPAEGHRP